MNKNTKRIACLVFVGLLLCCIILMFTGCAEKADGESGSSFNYQIFNTTYNFDKAIIRLPNDKIIEGKVESWKDYDGDQLQVKIDGKTYLVHANNCVLINSGEKK